MIIKSGAFYFVVCDKCKKDFMDDNMETPLHSMEMDDLLGFAKEHGWIEIDGKHLCGSCKVNKKE